MITFNQVTYTYPESSTSVLQDLSFSLPAGSFTLVVGPSGVGKSTLLRCLNGLVPHFSGGALAGRITVNDLDPIAVTPSVMSRHVGFVFQDPEAQFVMDRVEDEVAFALENAALPREEMHIRVEEVLALLDLVLLRDRPLVTLSGGEKQRVAIAAALALRPQVLVLDEPTSQLDPQSAGEVLLALSRLNVDLGLTIVLAEHRLERLLPFVDSMVYLRGGAPALAGSPDDVLPHVDLTPPLVVLGKRLGWSPLPLTLAEAQAFSCQVQPAFKAPTLSAAISAPVCPPYLRAEGVEVSYQGTAVLRGVDLTLYPGEIAVLMGRNGAGKTTLLKALTGLVRPARGKVRLGLRNIARLDVADVCRDVGYLPQDPNALLFADTVLDELYITLRNHEIELDDVPVSPDALLTSLGLQDMARAYPRDLSVGERQRVALAAILVTQPGALLLDEPTRGLDYAAKRGLLDLLRGWRDLGMAILLVTHDVEMAAEAADRVILLDQGYIIAQGAPSDVLGTSPRFAPQMARLFPGKGWLTVRDVLDAIAPQSPLRLTALNTS